MKYKIPEVSKESLEGYEVRESSAGNCLVRENSTDVCYQQSLLGCVGIDCGDCFFYKKNSSVSQVAEYLKKFNVSKLPSTLLII